MALEELRDSNRQIKQDGFTHLQSLYTTKRLFSGAVGNTFPNFMSQT